MKPVSPYNIQLGVNLFSIMSNLQTHSHFTQLSKNVVQRPEDKWLIHGTKHHKDNQLQRLELSCRIS